MTRRLDSIEAYWIDPLQPSLDSESQEPVAENRSEKPQLPQEAVLIIRDRIGFRYHRTARLNDFVSQREASALLGVPVMTVNRWVRSGDLPSETRNRFSVIRLAKVLAFGNAKGLIDADKVRTRLATGSPNHAEFTGFHSPLSQEEDIYVRLLRLDEKRSRRRGGDSAS